MSNTSLSVHGFFRPSGASPDRGGFWQPRSIIFLSVVFFCLWLHQSYLVPVSVGAVFAVALYPIMQKLEKKVSSRLGAALVVTALFLFFVFLPLSFLLLTIIEQVASQYGQLATLAEKDFSRENIVEILGLQIMFERFLAYLPVYEEELKEIGYQLGSAAFQFSFNLVQNLVKGLPNLFFSALIILLSVFFCLFQGQDWLVKIKALGIVDDGDFTKLCINIQRLCDSVLLASIVSGLVQAAIMFTGTVLAGVPNGLFLSTLTFVLSFIPLVGNIPVSLFLILTSYFVGDMFGTFTFLSVMGAIALSDYIVRPWVMGGSGVLHPFVAFVAAFAGLEMLGFWGLFLGPIIAGFVFIYLELYLNKKAKVEGRFV